mgnify:CR=1 FL=1
MIKHMKRIAVALLAFISFGNAQAGLISTDYKNSGDGLLTLDTDTGYEWMDFSSTLSRSASDLYGLDGSNEFSVGGDFEGFRYATFEEVTTMHSNAGIIYDADRDAGAVCAWLRARLFGDHLHRDPNRWTGDLWWNV